MAPPLRDWSRLVRPPRSLRARLALAYTLLTLLLTGLLAAAAYLGLTAALEQRLSAEVVGHARALEERLNAPLEALGRAPGISQGVYYQVLDAEGTVIAASQNLNGVDIPRRRGLMGGGREALFVELAPWSLGSRRAGTIVAAVDASEFARVRELAFWALAALAALATGLALPLGFALGGRALGRLEAAARRAAAVDPAEPRPLGLTGPRDDEVGALVAALDRTLERIRERQLRERGFLAEVAHELGTPLTVLTGRLETLGRESGDPRLAAARDAAFDIARTSEDLLLLARGELEPVLERYLLDVRSVAAAVLAEHGGGAVDAELPPHPLEIVGDPHRLRQATRNLVRNALRAAAATGGRVKVRLSRDGESALLEVLDGGPGVRPEDLPHLFERFYSRSGGSGVGLAVVRQVARAHGGEAWAEARPGGGARFAVRLPLAEVSAEVSPAEHPVEGPSEGNVAPLAAGAKASA